MKRFLFALMLLVCAGQAFAEDIFPAPWQINPLDPQWAGGQTLIAKWEGVHNATTAGTGVVQYPAVWNCTFPPAFTPRIEYTNAQIATAPGFNPPDVPIETIHIGDYDTPSDPIGGGIDIVICNNPLEGSRKVIHIQVTSDKGYTGPMTSSPSGTFTPGASGGYPGTSWYTYEATIDIPYNPPYEVVHIDFPDSTDISEIVVKTICVPVPEPSTLALGFCGLVGAVVLFRKRR